MSSQTADEGTSGTTPATSAPLKSVTLQERVNSRAFDERRDIMRVRLSTLVIAAVLVSVVPASAQYMVIDANGRLVGYVVGVSPYDPFPTLVAEQDSNGMWLYLPLLQNGLPSLDNVGSDLVYYVDAVCANSSRCVLK
jgi:hypothetical protein